MKYFLTLLIVIAYFFTINNAILFAQNSDNERIASIIGDYRKIHGFHSKYLTKDRDIIVWLPAGYQHHPRKRYPVLYLHDGQNVLDGATAYIPNQEWRADETLDSLSRLKRVPEMIIVAIDNGGEARISEYTHVLDSVYGVSTALADAYGKMIVEEVKPMIDRDYRTLSDAKHTGLGGASLGGLVTMYLGMKYPQVFGKLMVMSPSVWWANQQILSEVRGLSGKLPLKVWVDAGDAEDGNKVMENGAKSLAKALESKGWVMGKDLQLMIGQGHAHSEAAWAARFDDALVFLWGK